MFNKKSAFTLSEILIAVTIIGVIAALTVPMVLNDTTAKANRVKVQKAFTALSEALQVAENKLDYNTADLTSVTGMGETSRTLEKIFIKIMNATSVTFDTYPFGGQALARSDSGSILMNAYSPNGVGSPTVFKTQDGVYYVFDTYTTSSCTRQRPCIGYIDINGRKGPNELITCTSGTNNLFYYQDFGTPNGYPVSPAECTVDKTALTDIYPFVFYNNTAKPATSAFETVLNNNND